MLQKYYQILGASPSSSIDEIKRKYRSKAKLLHPDVNKNPEAHDQFVLLNEAYEYLINLKTGKIFINSSRSRQQKYDTYAQWRKDQREKARERAAFYAKKRYEEFIKSDYYKLLTSFDTVVEHLGFLASFFIVFILPVLLGIYYWPGGLFVGIGVAAITFPATWPSLMKYKKLKWFDFIRSFGYFSAQRQILVVFISVFNIIIFFRIGFRTLIPLPTLLGIYLQLSIILFLTTYFFRKKLLKPWRHFIIFAIAPMIISLLLMANFVFSKGVRYETYKFTNKHYADDGTWERDTNIILEGDTYSKYLGIRIFWNIEQMSNKSSITYKFADGLFGFRVVKDFEFN